MVHNVTRCKAMIIKRLRKLGDQILKGLHKVSSYPFKHCMFNHKLSNTFCCCPGLIYTNNLKRFCRNFFAVKFSLPVLQHLQLSFVDFYFSHPLYGQYEQHQTYSFHYAYVLKKSYPSVQCRFTAEFNQTCPSQLYFLLTHQTLCSNICITYIMLKLLHQVI